MLASPISSPLSYSLRHVSFFCALLLGQRSAVTFFPQCPRYTEDALHIVFCNFHFYMLWILLNLMPTYSNNMYNCYSMNVALPSLMGWMFPIAFLRFCDFIKHRLQYLTCCILVIISCCLLLYLDSLLYGGQLTSLAYHLQGIN